MENGLSISDTISLEVLSSITVRISCHSNEHDKAIGTGIIVKDRGCFYVLTAAHCLETEDHYKFLDNEIKIESVWESTSQSYQIMERVALNFEEDKDFAILRINEPINNNFDFEQDLLMIRHFSNKNPATTYGFDKGAGHKGRSYNLEIASHQKWSVKEGILEKGQDTYNVMSGLSGGGLFIKNNGKYLCVGYVKGIELKSNILQDVTVFPMSHFDYDWETNWYDNLDKALNAPAPLKPQSEHIVQITNGAKINYENLWSDLYSAIYNNQEATGLIKEIQKEKELYPVSKNTRYQKKVISHLFWKKEKWSEDEQKAFLMALYDKGLWPSLYDNLPQQAVGIENQQLFDRLEERGKTILTPESCNIEKFVDFDDPHKYEEILRAAFCFEFDHMYILVSSWSPSGQWIIKKAILKNLFGKDELTSQQLKDYIEKEKFNTETKYIAAQAYNLIDITIPSMYGYNEYNKAGLDSFVTVANSITDNIDKKQDKIKPYGVHFMVVLGSEDVSSFPEALHLLAALIETGLTTSRPFLEIVACERWYKVCRHLISFCPLPILFYTLQYSNDKLLRKVGQDLAYRYDEQNLQSLPNILRTLLSALTCKHLPLGMHSSIYQLTRELYVAVDENEWYEFVRDNILLYLCKDTDFYRVTISDVIFQNVQTAIHCLKKEEHKKEVFILLLDYLKINSILINVLINDELNIQDNFFDSDELQQLKVNFINNTSLHNGYCVFYKLFKSDNLEEKDLNAIGLKAQQESLNFAIGDPTALGMLLDLINNEETIDILKHMLFSRDLWNCGIQEEGNTFSLPNSSHLEKLSIKVKWTKIEWEKITQNMHHNLTLLKMQKTKEMSDMYFKSEYLSLMAEMKQFLLIQKRANNLGEPELERLLDETLAEKRGYTELYDTLMSENHQRLSEGYSHLCTLVKIQGINDYEDEIDLIINSAILKNKIAIAPRLRTIDNLVHFYKVEMVEKYGSKLIRLLQNMIDYDYEKLDVNVPQINRYLHNIAEALSIHYQENRVVDYWLKDKIVNRFN